MKLKKSKLVIDSLLVIASNISTIPVNNECKFPLFDNLDLDIDYRILTNSKEKSKYKILLTISGNKNKPMKPGYFFSIGSEGIFHLLDIEQMTKIQIDNFLSSSALPMLISYTRTYLMNTTANYPYGKYMLPSLDLFELLKDKREVNQTKKSVKS